MFIKTEPSPKDDADFVPKKVNKKTKRKSSSALAKPEGVRAITSYFGVINGKAKDLLANQTDATPDTGSDIILVHDEDIAPDTEPFIQRDPVVTCDSENISQPEPDSVSEAAPNDDKLEYRIVNQSDKQGNVSESAFNDVVKLESDDVNEVKPDNVIEAELVLKESSFNDTPQRRRSSRIQKMEEQQEIAKKEMETIFIEAKTSRRKKRKLRESGSQSDDAIVVSSDTNEEDSSDFINDSDDSDFERKAKKRKKNKNKPPRKIPLMFLTGKERENELKRLKQEKESKKIVLDAATLEFLQSGVPDVVLKAQKHVQKKQEEDEYLSTVQFFPIVTHTARDTSELPYVDNLQLVFNLHKNSVVCDSEVTLKNNLHSILTTNKTDHEGRGLSLQRGHLCCGNFWSVRKSANYKLDMESVTSPSDSQESSQDMQSNPIPWVEKYKVIDKKDLVVDKEAFAALEKWLKLWKSAIRDDGGASRKVIEKKKKRKDSDSDFVTSEDEDHEFKKKSVLLYGSTGCGKTAAVYVLAKHLGFHIVEVNFSSRRSGKEVIQRVEEATLSHRLESSSSCLILFKDIELLHADEDEGFHSAVAQLISASCRPIVMTTQQQPCSPLDAKIAKADPLPIRFGPPSASSIVKKVLLPMCTKSCPTILDTSCKNLMSNLNSIVRHAHCDIRKSINQTQLLFSSNFFSYHNLHKHCSAIDNLIDLCFVCRTKEVECSTPKLAKESRKQKKIREISKLEEIANNLSCLADLDWFSQSRISKDDNYGQQIASYFDETFRGKVSLTCTKKSYANIYEGSDDDEQESDLFSINHVELDLYRKLMFENDTEVDLRRKINDLSEDLESYCDLEGDWQSWACVRSIVKTNSLDAVGRTAKRHGRLSSYFNRLDSEFVQSICNTLGFSGELEIAKAASKR